MYPAPPSMASMESHMGIYHHRSPRRFAIRRASTTLTATMARALSSCTTLTKPLLRIYSESYRVLSSTAWDRPYSSRKIRVTSPCLRRLARKKKATSAAKIRAAAMA